MLKHFKNVSHRLLSSNANKEILYPRWLIAELTYRCPLQCPYCSNPVEMARNKTELPTKTWLSIFKEARELGVAQLGFTGGEPLLKPDIDVLIRESSKMGFYTNLITSSVGMTREKLETFKKDGLDSIQISFQAENRELNDKIAGKNSFQQKMDMIKLVKEYDFPLTLNIVLHRHNIDNIERILDICVESQADYVEIANTQYHGWAFKNQKQLLPSKEQVEYALKKTNEYKEIYKDKPNFIYVIPDYLDGKPKPCMGGWGQNVIAISPEGSVMPCLSAKILPEIQLPKYEIDNKENNLENIWYKSKTFNKFRGFDWMESPCKSCDKRFVDYGGCRCQAYMLTGNTYATDPVCSLSPNHEKLLDSIKKINKIKPDISKLEYRNMKNSKKYL